MNLFAIVVCIAVSLSCNSCHAEDPSPPPCSSPIYCHGELLHTVQLANIFSDSKTFVDKKLRHAPSTVLANFESFMNATNHKPSQSEIQQFVEDNFSDGDELENWTPPDFNPEPSFLKQISNETVQNFTRHLINIWPKLARKVKDEVFLKKELYSLIPVSHGFIIPGGRFREYYYWDSYWIIQGLLISDMAKTAGSMIENLISLVQRYGFIPNGGRVYYLNRSQPPLLTAMVYHYFQNTKDKEWLVKNIEFLDKELQFWLSNRTINVKTDKFNFTLAHYGVESTGPRPESYKEDFELVSKYNDQKKQQQLYKDIKSGAEAGWDFSSRWFIDEKGGNQGNLSNIHTRRIIPVDLNAILCGAFRNLAEMYQQIGNADKSNFWATKHLEWRKMIGLALWDENDGIWYDFDAELLKSRKYFYPSVVAPLWMQCFEAKAGPQLGKSVAQFLKNKKVLNYIGGVPTSLELTGEQWDLPNAWPPLQDMVVEGLERSGSPEAIQIARTFAERWVESNILGLVHEGEMFEKYDALNPGRRGGGGEYIVQTGFGWSNGVALKFIYNYYRKPYQNITDLQQFKR